MRSLLLFSSSLLLVACGGIAPVDHIVANVPPSAPPGGTANPPVDPPTQPSLGVEGSFDLQFRAVTPTFSNGGGPPNPTVAPPSLAKSARLDIRRSGAGYEAVLTQRWGTSGAYAVAVSADALVLTGEAYISGTDASSFAGAADKWKTLRLARGSDGSLTGDFSGEGEETVGEGDVVWQGTLVGSGSFAVDVLAPEIRGASTSFTGRTDAILPWDPVVVDAAEPVHSAVGMTAVRVQLGSDDLPLRWDAPTAHPESWAGETRFTAHVDDWAHANAHDTWQLVGPGGVLLDLRNNALVAHTQDLKFISLGAPMPSITFNDDVVQVSPWGNYAMYGGGITGTADPRCEAGGCFRVGPVTYGGCGLTPAGFAGQLQRVVGASGVAVRYRVLEKSGIEGPDSQPPFTYGPAMTIEVAASGASAIDTSTPGTLPLTKLAATIDDMTWGTDWITLDATAPAGSGPLGIAISAGGPSLTRGGCGGPPPPPTQVEILVESVTTK